MQKRKALWNRARRAQRSLRRALARHYLFLGIVAIAAIGVGGVIWGATNADKTSGGESGLWLVLAKAGVQIVAISVVGGGVATTWRAIAARREREALRRDKIRVEFAELVLLYNGVKTVRRALRSLGLDAKLHIAKEDRREEKGFYLREPGRTDLERAVQGVVLTQDQASGFHDQMRSLNSLQLGFEEKVRQFEQADLLVSEDAHLAHRDRQLVVENLRIIESFLNESVNLWEERGWTIAEGSELQVVSDGLQPLFRQDLFRPGLSHPMREITGIINRHLFRPSR